VFIGAEKISYYQKFTSNNTLAQIHRSVDGTAINANITSNLSSVRVVNASVDEVIPNIMFTTSTITSDTAYTTADNVTLKLTLTGLVSANVGDIMLQKFANTTVAATLQVLDAVTASNVVPAIIVSGALTNLTANTITINGVGTTTALKSQSILGAIQANGAVIVSATPSASVTLQTTKSWYTPGVSTPSDGTGLINSNTQQAEFLLQNPGYMP
jgi:hypothetical protein